MKRLLLRAAAIGLAAGLSACGGGGGNPGVCTGSPAVCIEGGNPNFEAPAPVDGGSVAPSTPPATTTTTPGTGSTPSNPATGTTGNAPGSTAGGTF